MAKSKTKDESVKRRPPHTLSKEHAKRVLESDALRASNPLRKGPGAKNPADNKTQVPGTKTPADKKPNGGK